MLVEKTNQHYLFSNQFWAGLFFMFLSSEILLCSKKLFTIFYLHGSKQRSMTSFKFVDTLFLYVLGKKLYNLPFFSSSLLECLRNEKSMMGSKVYRRQVCMSPTHREVPKTNGHSVSLPTSIIPELHSSPRLGRPLNLRSYGMPRYSLHLVFWLVKKYSPFPKSCFLLYNLSLYCKPFSVHV